MAYFAVVNCFFIEISVVFNWKECKLLIFTKHHYELLMSLDHHGLSMPTSLLAVKQEDVVSSFLIRMSLVAFSSFVRLEKLSIVVQEGAFVVLIFGLFLNFAGIPLPTARILLLQATESIDIL